MIRVMQVFYIHNEDFIHITIYVYLYRGPLPSEAALFKAVR